MSVEAGEPQPKHCPTCYGNMDEQGHCHGSACLSGPAAALPSPVAEWSYRGLTLSAHRNAGPRMRGGLLDLADLELFVARVRAEMPDATIAVHEYGLRAVWSDGRDHGPAMEWNWD